MTRSIIVAFSVVKPDGEGGEYTDHWEHYEDLPTAKARYADVMKLDGLVVAAIAGVIEGTDYDKDTP